MSAQAAVAAPLSRREFLYYVWAASMALFMAEAGGAWVWFAVPRFRAGEFGGLFTLDVAELPPPDSAPVAYDAGRFWLVHVGPQTATDPLHPPGYETQPRGLVLYKVCVHLGCLYKWLPSNHRFECPCHGSKFLLDGTRVHRPATRNLDQFVVRALDAEGQVLAETRPEAAGPLPLPPGTAALQVDTGRRITGRLNSGPNRVE